MRNILVTVFAFLLLLNTCLFARQRGIGQADDSLPAASLDTDAVKIRQLAAEHLSDSIKSAALERQISQLKASDNIKRAALLNQLAAIKHADSLRVFSRKHRVDSLRRFVKGFPVAPFRDTLFFVYTRQGSFTAQERAEAVTRRIARLGSRYDFNKDSLKLVNTELTTDIVFRDLTLISVSQTDALWQNTSTKKLAYSFRKAIADAITTYRSEMQWQTLVKEGLAALLVLLVTALIIYGITRFFKWFIAKLKKQNAWFTRGIKIKNYELLNSERQVFILTFIFRVFKWFLIILVIYLALPILFNIFPFTRNLSGVLISYVTTPLKKIGVSVWDYLPNLVTILVLLFIFRYVLRFIAYFKDEIENGKLKISGFYAEWANPTYQIIKILILAFMLIVIFPYLPGSDSGVFKGVSVFIGVLFTFGSASALGNIVSGVVMTYTRAFKLGDRVKIGEVTGDITEKTLLVTRIRTIQNEIISIPNSTVMSNHTVNYSSYAAVNGLILHTSVTIGYDAPWRQVHQLLIDAALDTPMIEKEPDPYVYQTSLDDYYVSYRINAFTKEPNKQAAIYSALHANIQDQFNKAGVEIMSPHYKALRDGNATTIPPDYLPKDYSPPGFITQPRKKK